MKRSRCAVVAALGALWSSGAQAGTDSVITQVSDAAFPFLLGLAGIMVIWFVGGAGLAYAQNRSWKDSFGNILGPMIGAGVVGLAAPIGQLVGGIIGGLVP